MSSLYAVKTQPKANEKSIIVVGNVRITVLFDRLVRLEKVENGNFEDNATQGVWFRRFDTPNFSYVVEEDKVIVQTDKVTYNVFCDNLAESTVTFADGLTQPIYNDGVLQGTARTLDMFDGSLDEDLETPTALGYNKLAWTKGIVSTKGVAVWDDSNSVVMAQDGNFAERKPCVDLYVFAYQNNYRDAVNAFYAICGATPLIPRYALGNWWSRYYAYTDKEYLNLMDKFISLDIPLSVATVDMDWHYVDIKRHFGTDESGWTGYSWNVELFPDYKGFLRELHKRNLKVTLNLHPADGVRYFEDAYPEFSRRMGVADNNPIPCDYTNPKYVKNYFELLHYDYEKAGVDFWWMDWQQGVNSKVKNLDPLWLANHYHYYDNCKKGNQGLILSRYCGAGAHRYPLGFSGDTFVNWETLSYLPQFTADATNIGFTWWSHDIGAHQKGYKDDELYLRWLQFGVFSPVNRLHSSCASTMGKEPWKYQKSTELVAVEYLRLRHKLLPYIYTYSHLTHTKGIALIEPMYYQQPQDELAYQIKNQYYFGSELVVAPITQPTCKGIATRQVYLPTGIYHDIFTDNLYKGGRVVGVNREMAHLPVFAKEGSIVPLSLNKGNDTSNPTDMEILVFNGDNSFTMVEDDGKDKIVKTHFAVQTSRDRVTLTIDVEGDWDVIPDGRNYLLNFRSVYSGEVISATADGVKVDCHCTHFDNLKVKVCGKQVKVVVKCKLSTADMVENPLLYVKRKALEILDKAQGDNNYKSQVFDQINNATCVGQVQKIVRKAKLSKQTKSLFDELYQLMD